MNHDYREKPRHEIDREARKASFLDFGIIGVSGFVGLVGVFAPLLLGDTSETVERAVYSTIVAASLGALLAVSHRLHVFHAESLRLMNVIIRLRNDLAATASWAQKKSLLENMKDPMIGEACCELLEDYESMFDVGKSSLTLRDRKWSLHFNGIFWRSMIAYGKGRRVIVLVTHTSGVENWNGPEAAESLEEQRDFISEGDNTIIRMFVDQTARRSDPIPPDYRTMMQEMEERYRIKTLYVGARSLRPIPDATWVPGLNIFMTWTGSSGEHFQIGSSLSELRDFKRSWPRHIARAKSLDDSPVVMPPEIAAYFKSQRRTRRPPAAARPARAPRQSPARRRAS